MKHEIVEGSPIDPAQLRRALECYPTGICVITCRSDEGLDMGMTVSSVNSLSLEPPLKLFSIRKAARKPARLAGHAGAGDQRPGHDQG